MNDPFIPGTSSYIIVALIAKCRNLGFQQFPLVGCVGVVAGGALPVVGDGGMPCDPPPFRRIVFVALSTFDSLLPDKEGEPIGSVGVMTGGAALLKSIMNHFFPFSRVIVTLETYLVT